MLVARPNESSVGRYARETEGEKERGNTEAIRDDRSTAAKRLLEVKHELIAFLRRTGNRGESRLNICRSSAPMDGVSLHQLMLFKHDAPAVVRPAARATS